MTSLPILTLLLLLPTIGLRAEEAFDGINDLATDLRELRGGSWFFSAADMNSLDRESYLAISSTSLYIGLQGFRVASVPEPSSLSLLVLGGVVLALRRRREYIIVVVARL